MPTDGDRVATSLVAGGRQVSVLVHGRGLLDVLGFAQEIASAARLAIEHERLHALRHAQLERLRLSRARLVATAEAQRWQLERNMHDGAQQRLLTLSIAVRLARRKLGGGDVSQIFLKLEWRESHDQNRRVLAVLAFLRSG